MRRLDEQLAALATMSPVLLRAEWLRVYKAPAPDLTTDLLRRGIAHRLQEKVHGGLAPATVRDIDRLYRQYARTGAVAPAAHVKIKPGTRLVRDWGDASHHVLVLEDGYLYQDRRYSLSRIAEEVTGARWSGPRFFGLMRRKTAETADA